MADLIPDERAHAYLCFEDIDDDPREGIQTFYLTTLTFAQNLRVGDLVTLRRAPVEKDSKFLPSFWLSHPQDYPLLIDQSFEVRTRIWEVRENGTFLHVYLFLAEQGGV